VAQLGGVTSSQIAALSSRVLQEGFRLGAGEESELINEAPGQYFVVKVDEIVPPRMPGLDEIRPELTQEWMSREIRRRLTAAAGQTAPAGHHAGACAGAGASGDPIGADWTADRRFAGGRFLQSTKI
jgi:hypothetical protein